MCLQSIIDLFFTRRQKVLSFIIGTCLEIFHPAVNISLKKLTVAELDFFLFLETLSGWPESK